MSQRIVAQAFCGPHIPVWRKSLRSSDNGQCVEVAFVLDALAVRDRKNPTGPPLVFAPAAFAAFLDAVKAGLLDG